MSDFSMPVAAFGAGSQPEVEALDCLPLPHEMATFSQPIHHLEAEPEVLAGACAVMENLRAAMLAGSDASIELLGLPPKVVELINQSLGHGEVSVLVREPGNLYLAPSQFDDLDASGGMQCKAQIAPRGHSTQAICNAAVRPPDARTNGQIVAVQGIHIQETVFAGVWRVQEVSGHGVRRDALLACAIPDEVRRSALSGATKGLCAPPQRAGIMNAPAILNELRERSNKYQTGQPAHVINLSLLPMSPEDLEYLFEAFGTGAVSILSRGYGNCRITSTRLANVWWVQYFNNSDQIILNTIEVVGVPEVALAAAEDYQDSAERLGEWLAVMREQHPHV